MSRQPGAGLARITLAAPRRRVDVALPEQVPVAELLPSLLPGLLQSLAPLVKDLPIGDLLQKLIAAIPAAPTARGPLPDPGMARPAA